MMEFGGGDVETTTEDSSIDVTDSTCDLSDLSGAHTQGLALLQKLQQLKVSGIWMFLLMFNFFILFILFPGRKANVFDTINRTRGGAGRVVD